jgi:carboxyl-terminal processing protease
MSYSEAFEAMFEKVAHEYPFTADKNIDWGIIKEKYLPGLARVSDDEEFYKFLHDFIQEIPDAHVGMPVDGQVFFDTFGGSIGLVLAELSDKSVIVTNVIPDSPAAKAGIQPGAEITSWNDMPVTAAIDAVVPYFGPYSTQHHRRLEQVIFLTRAPAGTNINLNYRNPGAPQAKDVRLKTETEYDSLFASLPELSKDPVLPPVEGQILDDSGLGYIRVNTFSADYSLMASLWDHFISDMISQEVSGIIIDLRVNSGGSGSLALDFAGYFFDRDSILFGSLYYNENTGNFEKSGLPAHLRPGPKFFEGPIGILVSPYCISACESFAYALSLSEHATVVGHFPSAGAFGEVGRGQYQLPADITMQFPTGRHETPDGELLLEGIGVEPDIVVPVTAQSALGQIDAVLDAAVNAINK